MTGFTECPNCVQDRIIVPLKPKGHLMICALCESEYQKDSKSDFILPTFHTSRNLNFFK